MPNQQPLQIIPCYYKYVHNFAPFHFGYKVAMRNPCYNVVPFPKQMNKIENEINSLIPYF